MKLKTHLKSLLISSLLVTALCVTQASALEYGFDGADDYLFADPTSQDVIYQTEDQNVNRSKTAALIAPGFGTPTSYHLHRFRSRWLSRRRYLHQRGDLSPCW